MPKVSIVLPCYNGERFLSQSLDSVLAQTMTDWELIIVNDCSTDNTANIANDYARRDSRISVIHNETNQKLPKSLNIGFAAAHGEYLTWTSDDNIAKPNWLSTLVEYLDTHPSTDMVSANMDLIDENGVVFSVARQKCGANEFMQLACRCNVGAAFMYRKSIADLVGEYDVSMFCAEDYDYWIRIALKGRIDYIDDNIYMYRQNPGSLTATQQPRIKAVTLAVKNKYKSEWLKKLHLNWWQRKKFDYFVRNAFPCSEFSIVGFRHVLGRQIPNILFFWNKSLRRKIKNKLTVKL